MVIVIKILYMRVENFHLGTASTETAEDLVQRASSSGSGAGASAPQLDGRAFRRSLNKTGRYIRKPIDDADSLALMEEHGVGYSSTGLVARMRANGNIWQEGVRRHATGHLKEA